VRLFIPSALVSIGVLGLAPGAALANTVTVPVFDGVMDFPAIQGPSDPEEYSWQVELGENQELEQIDEQTATIFYEDHYPAFSIFAAAAHDSKGTKVPTTLSVSEGSIITLTVHHRAGNPAAGGKQFLYPITSGPVLETGYKAAIITGAPDEQGPRELCVVPRLKGKFLPAARKRLRGAGCRVGDVARLKGATARTGKVVTQSPKPGAVRTGRAAVSVTLGK